MIAYQRALARALEQGHGSVPGVPDEAVRHFARVVERKRRSGAGRSANARVRRLAALFLNRARVDALKLVAEHFLDLTAR